ncbi:hypothetical protein [Streptomyces sp. SID3212]|uniref:hypothetical protein n=1 Tax=Streptomyces sp. SID3212 TaxID=2690259 RepID=UPI001F1BB83E|nr:hypothetical protein [Streptomyces sp. SID3212]
MVSRARGAFTSVVAVVALVGLVGCGDDGGKEQGKSAQGRIEARELCRGNLSGDAVDAVQLITGAEEFSSLDSGDKLESLAQAVVDDYLADGVGGETHRVCGIYLPGSTLADVGIDVSLEDGDGVGDGKFAGSFKQYDLGREGLASPRKAVLYAECVSEKFEGGPVMLRAALNNRDEPDGDAERLRKANLTLLHSVTLALVEQLGCEDRAGLPETAGLA